jgi:hypothetical protein
MSVRARPTDSLNSEINDGHSRSAIGYQGHDLVAQRCRPAEEELAHRPHIQ